MRYGTVINVYDYNLYGTISSSTGSTANPIRYANGYYDTSTALYKYGARYYNTADARWTQLDPSGQDKSYPYAGDNPVNFVDPSGLISLSGITTGIGATVGAGILIGLCPETAGLTCAVAAGFYGGFAGGFYGSLVGGGSLSQARDDAVYGGIGGATGGLLF